MTGEEEGGRQRPIAICILFFNVTEKPDVPVLSVPSDIISGEEVTFTTTWNAGSPLMGTIVHDIIKGFTNLPNYIRNETTTTRQQKCEIIVQNR